jgi:hypothetical protein
VTAPTIEGIAAKVQELDRALCALVATETLASLVLNRGQSRDRRERIATAILAGLATDPRVITGVHACEIACEWAEELERALDAARRPEVVQP